MAIHGIDYDRSLERLFLSGDVGVDGGFGGRFTGGLLGWRSRVGTGRLGLVLF